MKCRYYISSGGLFGYGGNWCKCGTYPGMVSQRGITAVDSEYASYYCMRHSEDCEQAYNNGFCNNCGTPVPANMDYCRGCNVTFR